jgi:hypothetical protein
VTAGGKQSRRNSRYRTRNPDLEHRGEAGGQLLAARHFEGDLLLGQRLLGPHDALGDGRLGHEEGARDLLRGQAAEEPEGERDASLGGEHRMAGDEHQAQEVVAHVLVDRGLQVRHGQFLPDLHLAAHLLQLAVAAPVAAQDVDGAALRGGHQPGARVLRDARRRPLLDGGDQRVLRQLLGDADVAHHPRQAGDEPRRLDAEGRFDRLMIIGRWHGGRSEHLRAAPQAKN